MPARFVCLVLALLLAISPLSSVTPAAAQSEPAPTPVPLPPEDLQARVAELQPLLEELYTTIDPTRVDLEDLSFEIAFDAADIFTWMAENIAFRQYPGAQRGARGVLLTAAGNALDQSILATQLLGDAGYDVRIAQGRLSEKDASRLLEQMAAAPAASPRLERERVSAILTEIGALYGLEPEVVASELDAALNPAPLAESAAMSDTLASVTLIAGALAEAGIELGDEAALDALVEEARDYYWVEYRLGPTDRWQAAHPAFGAAAAPAPLRASATFADELPTGAPQWQRLRVAAFIEQKDGDTLVTHTIVPAQEYRAADLAGQSLTFQLVPNGISGFMQTADIDGMLDSTDLFLPALNGEVVEDGFAFDLQGDVLDMAQAKRTADGMVRLAKSVSGALEGAAGLLGDLGETETGTPAVPEDAKTLTAVWLEYTLIGQDGGEKTVRRYLLDRVGAANRAEAHADIDPELAFPAASRALLTHHTVVLLPGDYTRDYLAARLLQRMIDELALTPAMTALPEEDEPDRAIKAIRKLAPLDDVVLAAAFAAGAAAEGNIVYRAEPALVVVERGLLPGGPFLEGFARVDVISNARRAFTSTDDGLAPDPAAVLFAGVWETQVEGAPLLGLEQAHFNAARAVHAAVDAGQELLVVTPGDTSLLDDLALDAESRANLEADLARGYVVVVPKMEEAGEDLAWWRVDPRTGETLGIGRDGRGTEGTEYTITLQGIIESTILGTPKTIASIAICTGQGGSVGCCVAENAAYFAGGMLLGFGIIKTLGATVALLSTDLALNNALFLGGATGIIPSACT
ncbi:MAG: hypothetical protein H3C34_03735 [Caldilineaceae bacterium]|nr:hypothetical protein [Caldilineaceae bacterium]